MENLDKELTETPIMVFLNMLDSLLILKTFFLKAIQFHTLS